MRGAMIVYGTREHERLKRAPRSQPTTGDAPGGAKSRISELILGTLKKASAAAFQGIGSDPLF